MDFVDRGAGRDVPGTNSGMRVFKRAVAERYFGIFPEGFSFTIPLAMLTNYRPTLFVPISYKQRVGRSKIRPVHDTLRFVIIILRTGVYFAPTRIFSPFVVLLLSASILSLTYDVFFLENLTDKTVLLFAMNSGMFALLADMIDKRSN